MDTKQLLLTGGAVAATAKFYGKLDWKSALIVAGVAIVAASMADNLLPSEQ